jgi:hypothetical protein
MLASASFEASVQAASVEKLPTCVTDAGAPGTNIISSNQYVILHPSFIDVPPHIIHQAAEDAHALSRARPRYILARAVVAFICDDTNCNS